MRKQIKFRVWDGKEMCEVLDLSFKLGEVSSCTYITKEGGSDEPGELIQYTGIKNKDGEEILITTTVNEKKGD